MPTDQIDEILQFDPMQKPRAPADDDIINEILALDPARETPRQAVPSQSQPPLTQAETLVQGGPQAAQLAAQVEPKPMAWKDTLKEAWNNIPESALDVGDEMVSIIKHPIQTFKGFGKLLLGAMEYAPMVGGGPHQKYVDAFIDYERGRYGNIENFKQTLAREPMSVYVDALTFLMYGGVATKVAGKMAKLPSLAKVGETAAMAGATADPFNLATRTAALPLKLVPEKIPIALYQSAAKFNTTLSSEKRIAVTKTAISAQNQIMPTVEGMKKLRGMIDDYNAQVSSMIDNAMWSGEKIPTVKLRKGLDRLKEKMLMETDEPASVQAAFKRVEKNLVEMDKLGLERTPQGIQRIKQNIYQELATYYAKRTASPARVKIRKLVARNARLSLEEIIPEIKMLNKNEGALIELWDAVERKANRISNRDLMGIGLPIKTGAGVGLGYAFGGQTGGKVLGTLALIHGIMDSPVVKAKLALVLNRLSEKGIKVRKTTALARLTAVKAGEAKELEDFLGLPQSTEEGSF